MGSVIFRSILVGDPFLFLLLNHPALARFTRCGSRRSFFYIKHNRRTQHIPTTFHLIINDTYPVNNVLIRTIPSSPFRSAEVRQKTIHRLWCLSHAQVRLHLLSASSISWYLALEFDVTWRIYKQRVKYPVVVATAYNVALIACASSWQLPTLNC